MKIELYLDGYQNTTISIDSEDKNLYETLKNHIGELLEAEGIEYNMKSSAE